MYILIESRMDGDFCDALEFLYCKAFNNRYEAVAAMRESAAEYAVEDGIMEEGDALDECIEVDVSHASIDGGWEWRIVECDGRVAK